MGIRVLPEIRNLTRGECYAKVIDGQTHVYIVDEVVIDSADFEQRVKVVSLIIDKQLGIISEQLGVTQTAFLLRCRTGKLSFVEQKQIAALLGCEIVAKFTFDDGKEIFADTAKQLVADACQYAKIAISDLYRKAGKSRQAFYKKLDGDRLTYHEMCELAKLIGCTYSNYFQLENGLKI